MIKVGKGKDEVTIDGILGADLEAEIRGWLGPIADEMEKEADTIRERIRTDWPIKTGKSRAAWQTTLRVHPGSMLVEIHFSNEHVFVRWIQSTKLGRQTDARRLRSPMWTEVRTPAREVTKTLMRTLPWVLARAIETGDYE